ncbi:MAG: hypothetical protein ABFS12_03715 [Bacteroidota bacterium]
MNKTISTFLLISFLTIAVTSINAQTEINSNKFKTEKKEKKKKELMEFITEKSCDEFNALNVEILNIELINKVFVKIATDYHKKLDKHYEMLSEKGTEEFLTDLVEKLNANCKLIQNYINKRQLKL